MKNVFNLALFVIGSCLTLPVAATSVSREAEKVTVVAEGTQIEVIRPIVVQPKLIKLLTLPASGVLLQHGVVVPDETINMKLLARGACVIAPMTLNGQTDVETFMIPPQMITVTDVSDKHWATATVVDSEKQKRSIGIGCECEFDDGPILSPRCLRLGFERVSHASSLDLFGQARLNAEDKLQTSVRTVRARLE